MSFIINTEYQVVFSYHYGSLTFADAVARRERLLADPRFQPEFRQLADFTEMDGLQMSRAEAEQMAAMKVFHPQARRAFVMSRDLPFGLARMFHAYQEINQNRDVNISVFRNLDEAVAWIGVPAEIASAALAELRLQRSLV